MPIISVANFKKTLYYLKRNGLKNTWDAIRERVDMGNLAKVQPYTYREPDRAVLKAQREECARWESRPLISILVPTFSTNRVFLEELIASVHSQSYQDWELVLADATPDDSVYKALKEICIVKGIPIRKEGQPEATAKEPGAPSGIVRYCHLAENLGISGNTNEAIKTARGDYCGLLDHDDVLTPDALYEMAAAIHGSTCPGGPWLLYSDEDKWNGEPDGYYEYHRKEDFNYDLLLSNNYICHFCVMETGLLKSLRLRPEYDGAQDYDLILRAVDRILEAGSETRILHIAKTLYHWRCHSGSTAENPASKTYAYEAGLRALQDLAKRRGMEAVAEHSKHLGFYHLRYGKKGAGGFEAALDQRPDLGAVGGKLTDSKGTLLGGRMDDEGNVYYEGLKAGFSGYMHRAVLTQDAEAVDLRCICVSEDFFDVFEDITGVPYVNAPGTDRFDVGTLPPGADIRGMSLKLCAAIRASGRRILWDPGVVQEIKATEKAPVDAD